MTVREFVSQALTRQAGGDAEAPHDLGLKFSETGLDSLDLMELLNEVEEQFDIRITDDTVTAETTIGDFIKHIEAKVGQGAGERDAS